MDPHDFRQSAWYAQLLHAHGWQIETLPSGSNLYLRNIALTPFSLLFAVKINSPIPFAEIEKVARKYHSIYIHVESDFHHSDSLPENYQSTIWGTLPRKTIILNLKKTFNQQFLALHAKSRQNIRYALKLKPTIAVRTTLSSLQLHDVYQLLQATAHTKNFNQNSENWLQNLVRFGSDNVHIITTGTTTSINAVGVFICSSQTLHYIYSGSNQAAKSNKLNNLIIWEGIKLAVKLKLKHFDFEGVNDDRNPSTSQFSQGFTQFKKSFSTQITTFDLPICLHRFQPFNRFFYLKERILPLLYPYTI